MTDDEALRAAFIAMVLLVPPVGIYHRVKSQETGEHLGRRQEGWFILGDDYQAYVARTGRFVPRFSGRVR